MSLQKDQMKFVPAWSFGHSQRSKISPPNFLINFKAPQIQEKPQDPVIMSTSHPQPKKDNSITNQPDSLSINLYPLIKESTTQKN